MLKTSARWGVQRGACGRFHSHNSAKQGTVNNIRNASSVKKSTGALV